MLYIGFSNEGAIDELPVLGASRQDSPSLEPGDNGGNGRLRQLTLRVQLLPDLGNGQLAVVPEQAKDGGLELGQLLAIGHSISSRFLYTCRFYTCRTACQEEKFQGLLAGPATSPRTMRPIKRKNTTPSVQLSHFFSGGLTQ